MKKFLKEQEQMNEKDIFLKAISFGCIPKWLSNGKVGTYKGKKVYFGKNSKNETVIFFTDMTALNNVTGKKATWSCPQLKPTVGTTIDMATLTPDQQEYINSLKKNEGVVDTKPSDYETQKGKWQVIDLKTKNPKLFPQSVLVYKQTGEINAVSPQQENIINSLKGKGFISEQPKANESDLYIKVNLQTIENGKYREYFNKPFYMYQPIQNVDMSDLLKDQKTKFDSQKVDKKQCRQVIDILYTAYVKKYKLEDSERIAYKNYAQRCSQQKSFIFNVQKKLDTLTNLNPKDPSKLSLKLQNENQVRIKSIIHDFLISNK
jgi:cold shock CspA family protein